MFSEFVITWWQALILLGVLGIWGIWRENVGFQNGFDEKVEKYIQNYNKMAIDDFLIELRQESPDEQYQAIGMLKMVNVLTQKGIIRIDSKGFIHGYRGKKLNLKP